MSLPAATALALFAFGKILEAFGNRALGSDPTLGGVVIITFIMIPVATVILVGWSIACWANHGMVPGWLLSAAAGNALAFWIFYQMTRM